MCVCFVNIVFCSSRSVGSQKLRLEDFKLICPEIFPSGAGCLKKHRSRQRCKQGAAIRLPRRELRSSFRSNEGSVCFHTCGVSVRTCAPAPLLQQPQSHSAGEALQAADRNTKWQLHKGKPWGWVSVIRLPSACVGRKDCMACIDTRECKDAFSVKPASLDGHEKLFSSRTAEGCAVQNCTSYLPSKKH